LSDFFSRLFDRVHDSATVAQPLVKSDGLWETRGSTPEVFPPIRDDSATTNATRATHASASPRIPMAQQHNLMTPESESLPPNLDTTPRRLTPQRPGGVEDAAMSPGESSSSQEPPPDHATADGPVNMTSPISQPTPQIDGAQDRPIQEPAVLRSAEPLLPTAVHSETVTSRFRGGRREVPRLMPRVDDLRAEYQQQIPSTSRTVEKSLFPVPSRSEPMSGRPTDEPIVQIHIGRIEVRAAAPPTERHAAPSPPKLTVSLDDYLERNRKQ